MKGLAIGCVAALIGIAALGVAQSTAQQQFVLTLKRGPKWIAGKPASQQPLSGHGHYLQEQMDKGALLLAGPFLDDSGGLIVYQAPSEAAARAIEERDPGVADGILAIDSVRPFRLSFDAARRLSPFK